MITAKLLGQGFAEQRQDVFHGRPRYQGRLSLAEAGAGFRQLHVLWASLGRSGRRSVILGPWAVQDPHFKPDDPRQ